MAEINGLGLSAAEVLGEQGEFATALESFVPRESQQQLATAIETAIDEKQSLIAESGTGTGKTFAYLVPILLSGKKALISTGTKHLQEQLFSRDLPKVLDVLGLSSSVALLKGRSNYLCEYRLQQSRFSARRLDKRQLQLLESISQWQATTNTGDISELSSVAEDSPVWPQVTSTVDNCLGQKCDFFNDCFVNKARKKAMESDVVVINHHLYFADKVLKQDGFGALLPEAEAIVFDEAHQLPDIASNFLGKSVSTWQIMELCQDVRVAELQEKSLVGELNPQADALDSFVADLRLSFGLNERRISWFELLEEVPTLQAKFNKLVSLLKSFEKILEEASVAGEGLTRCYERCAELRASCAEIFKQQDDDSSVRWVEIAKRTFRVNETPLQIGESLKEHFANTEQVRVFTSATLSINQDFSHFRSLIGLQDQELQTAYWGSPFDYFNQAVLYVPEGLPEPKDQEFANAFFDHALPLLQASRGSAFVLFTSFKVMQEFEQYLANYDFSVLMQGESSKQELLQQFVKKPDAVLLGTMSFWEGVDVLGESLRCVIIDKLPFESPFEPVLKARLKALQDAGHNPFMNYQVPRAVITLRQGAGRLIRSNSDKGVLMIADPRLRGARYGKIFLDSLPEMRRTNNQQKVCDFLQRLQQSSQSSKGD